MNKKQYKVDAAIKKFLSAIIIFISLFLVSWVIVFTMVPHFCVLTGPDIKQRCEWSYSVSDEGMFFAALALAILICFIINFVSKNIKKKRKGEKE